MPRPSRRILYRSSYFYLESTPAKPRQRGHTSVVRAFLASGVLMAAMTVIGIAPAAFTHNAKLRVVDLTPVTVRGLGFRPGERVRVVLYTEGMHLRMVRASRRGAFVAKFAVYADQCAAFNLRATGASRTVAVVAKKPPPQCAALDPVP